MTHFKTVNLEYIFDSFALENILFFINICDEKSVFVLFETK